MQSIFLSKDEYEFIKNNKRFIGSGVDGSIYKINNNSIYKFYHKNQEYISLPNANIDNEGVIVDDFKLLRPYSKVNNIESINYTDSDGVILTREEAIYKAIEKQKNVKLTALPKNVIYVDNKIAGCEYNYYRFKLGIYSSVYLPLQKRLLICKKLLVKVKELLDNNIYPVTLAQRNEMFSIKSNGSNVLIGLNLDPVIIDLDGISTMYSDSFSRKYFNRTLATLSSLILELLSKVKVADIKDDDIYVISEYYSLLEEAGISVSIAKKFFDNNYLDFEDIENIIKRYELTKK